MSDLNLDSQDSDDGEQQENEGFNFSAQGKKMAASIAEYLLMRYFFPEMRDRKKQQKAKLDF